MPFVLVFGIVFGLVGILLEKWAPPLVEGRVSGLAHWWELGITGGLGAGLTALSSFGGLVCLQHFVLRYQLYRNGFLPFRLVPFLDYCTERIFLGKVGGGYIFVHRMLMEHFASLGEDGLPQMTEDGEGDTAVNATQ